MRLRIPGNSALTKFFLGPFGRIPHHGNGSGNDPVDGDFYCLLCPLFAVIDEKLRAGPFANNARIFRRARVGWRG
ncbi:MAG: hypothetical protein WDO73_11645 [Ignavibacteriota bacterium]